MKYVFRIVQSILILIACEDKNELEVVRVLTGMVTDVSEDGAPSLLIKSPFFQDELHSVHAAVETGKRCITFGCT